jgi:hypothetical protein
MKLVVKNPNNLPLVDISTLKPTQGDLKDLSEQNYNKLLRSLLKHGFIMPIAIWDSPEGEQWMLDGHQRQRLITREFEAHTEVPAVNIPAESLQEAAEILLKITSQYGTITQEGLDNYLATYELPEAEMLESVNFDGLQFGKTDGNEDNDGEDDQPKQDMTEVFIVPPFSVLDTKQGYWQERRRGWLEMGIQSEIGREGGLISNGDKEGLLSGINGGTSVFDPVLCEVMYTWFNTPGGTVLDPFAGGSVRGVVASQLGMQYLGHELREEQVEANRAQAKDICSDPMPVWTPGDSNATLDAVEPDVADMVFSCPPYADLEVYSDDPADLSTMGYEQFAGVYGSIIEKACSKLKADRFAVFVVGEVRDKKGVYYNFVGDTIKAFNDAGLQYYNELILVNSAGTLPLRAGRQFNNGRKVGKQHQNVLVFYKGNVKAIKDNYPVLELPSHELTDGTTEL